MNTRRIRVPEWEAVKSFCINWGEALDDGWIISDGMVIPPVGHKARDWCAYWYPTKSGISVPSWFQVGSKIFILLMTMNICKM